LTALHCRAKLLISTNTVVPNPATRRAIADIVDEPPLLEIFGIIFNQIDFNGVEIEFRCRAT
jgi:hypothetical protein